MSCRGVASRVDRRGRGLAGYVLIDVTGRVVAERNLRQAGRQSLDLAAGRRIRAGLYWLRLAQGPNVRTARVAVLE